MDRGAFAKCMVCNDHWYVMTAVYITNDGQLFLGSLDL